MNSVGRFRAVGHDVDGVLAVGVVAPARAAAEHLAHEVVVAVAVLAVDAGVADRLLVGRHPAVDGLGDDAGEHAEQPQDDEGAGVGRRRVDRREQGALLGEAHLDERHDALVDVELGHPLGGVGEVAQDRREPLLEEVAADVVAAVVDRALGLRAGAGEVDDQLRAAVAGAGAAGRRLGQGDPLGVQLRLVDAVVLGVVLPDVGAVGDLAEDLAAVGLGRRVEDRVEGRLDGVAAVAGEQLGEAAGAHEAGGALGVEVGGEAVRHPAVAGHDPQRGLVGHAGVPQLDRGDRQALLEHGARVARHRAGHGAADVVVVAEGLHERDDLALVEDRHGDAQVGQVADAALRLVDVVVEEDVALAHLGQREVAHDRVHERGVRAAGELAQLAVVDAGAEVVRVADHRAAAGAGDGGLDLHLDARQGALDDLDEDRVDGAALGGQPVAVLVGRGQAGGVDRRVGASGRCRSRRRERSRCGSSGRTSQASLVTTRLPNASTRTVKPGWTGTVEPNSSTIAGPEKVSPARRSGRQ